MGDERVLISMIDLTDLNDDCTTRDVVELCDKAARFGVAGVCVWPDFVAVAATELSHNKYLIDVVTVVNFPTGDERPFSVGVLTERCLDDGATEIDVVLPYRRFLDGDEAWCATLLQNVRSITEGRAAMKVILESGELGDPASIARAARLSIDCGADFVKTSTGKTSVSATPEAVEAIARVVAEADRPVGIKPSGGIRTAADARRLRDVTEAVLGAGWATRDSFRFGASGLLDALTVGLVDGPAEHS